jgi:hypothetical protein
MDDLKQETCSEGPQVFTVKDCALIAIATGLRAFNLKELRDILSSVNLASVYYHFWGGLLQPRFEEREYNNDFAAWTWYGLHDAALAERLAVVDPSQFDDLEELRQELLELIENRLDEKEYLFFKHANSRFEFLRSQIVIFDTRKRANDPRSLAGELPSLSTGSVFYHFIDARRRLKSGRNDFSAWLAEFGETYAPLCDELDSIDPYFSTLRQIREQLVNVFSTHFN